MWRYMYVCLSCLRIVRNRKRSTHKSEYFGEVESNGYIYWSEYVYNGSSVSVVSFQQVFQQFVFIICRIWNFSTIDWFVYIICNFVCWNYRRQSLMWRDTEVQFKWINKNKQKSCSNVPLEKNFKNSKINTRYIIFLINSTFLKSHNSVRTTLD